MKSSHSRNMSESLERYLGDDALPVPQSQFSHLRVERAELDAEARMRAILGAINL